MVFLSERISKHVFKTRFWINVLDVTHTYYVFLIQSTDKLANLKT